MEYAYNIYFNGDVTKQIAAKTYPQCRDAVKTSLETDLGKTIAIPEGERGWREIVVDEDYVKAKMKEYDDAWTEANPPPKPPPPKKVTAKPPVKKATS